MSVVLDCRRFVPILAAAILAGCAAAPRDADIRDVRPTQIHRGDKVTVEASRPLFLRGAETQVLIKPAAGAAIGPISARATTETRVLFDADAAFEALAGDARMVKATVQVVQKTAAGERNFTSAAAAPFEFDLFPPSLQKLAQAATAQPEGAPSPLLPPWVLWAGIMLIACLVIALPVPVIGGLVVVWERKISAWMQVRIGPNRVGPNGWLQWLADGIKLILKEDVIPNDADHNLFRISPYFAFVGLFLVFLVLPFSSWVVIADLNIGILFILAVTSLVVVSIIMGGWSSNSKWSLLGGMRSAAQIISYELPASVALLGVAAVTGSLSTQAIVRAQGGMPWDWFLFRNPFLFFAFFIYYISALAEGNRTPFDLPEAESELVSGFATEYSGFRYALYPLVEWVNVFVIGAVTAMLFLGGWQVPFVAPEAVERSGWLQLAGFAAYAAKIIFMVFVTIWIRWTLPRLRVDQMMNLCWKYLIPLAFACFVGTLAWEWLLPSGVRYLGQFAWTLLGGVLPAVLFWQRFQYNRSRFKYFTTNAMYQR